MKLLARHRRELREVLMRGRVSRTGLVDATQIRRNTVYDDIYAFLEEGLIRETTSTPDGRGRPRVPLEIDPQTRHVLGISFQVGRVQVGRFNLLGEPTGELLTKAAEPDALMEIASETSRSKINKDTFAVGISIPGFVDRDTREVVFSSVFPGMRTVSLDPLLAVVGSRPIVYQTEAHAVAARWLLGHTRASNQDTLLVYFEDGSLGAAFIVNGRPNHGCISGANELGHTRLQVMTRKCYCGGVGCIERVCDSGYLADRGLHESLGEALLAGMVDHPVMTEVAALLGTGFSNVINFTRSGRVVIASHLPNSGPWIDRIASETRAQLLEELRNRVQVETWPGVQARSARTAAYLALTSLYYEDW